MKTVRLISRVLFIITRLLSAGYLLSFLLSAIALTTGRGLHLTDQRSRFEVFYPFTQHPYLRGEYNGGYMLMFLMILGLYAFFFFLVGNVFTVFTQTKLFTAYGIRQLKRFYVGNLVLPPLSVVVISLFYSIDSPAEILLTLHMLLGVFTYFLAAIFSEGVNLQNEHDLIL